jgi:CHAT domain-containing protein/tetratricopeptide (TPR) repeat protein
MIDVKKSCCPPHSIPSIVDRLPSILIFCILFSLIVIISAAFSGCAPKQMTLDEAKQTTISMRGKSFVPPPRSIDDILKVLDTKKVGHLSTGKGLLDKSKREPPMGASEGQLSKFYLERGEAAFFLGYLHQSLYDFQKAYDLAPSESPKSGTLDDRMQNITIMSYLAWVEKLLGNYHKAIALFRKAAEEENVMSYANLSRLYAEVGDFDEAAKMRSKGIAFFEKVMRSSSPNYRAVLFRARMEYVYLESTGRFGDAEQYHQEAVRQAVINHSNRPNVSIDEKGKLALNLLNQKRLVEAEITARKVIEESTQLSGMESAYVINYLQILAEIFLAQGRLKHADEIIKVALQMHENVGITSESQYYCLSKNTLGKILAAGGDYSGAADQFEYFKEKEHSNRYLYEIYYSQNIDAMLALAMTAKSKEIMPSIESAYRKSQKVFGENYLQTAELLAIRGIAKTKFGEFDLAYADLAAAIPIITKQTEIIDNFANNYRSKIIIERYLDLLARIQRSALEKRLGIDASVEAFRIADVLKDQVVQGSILASTARMTIEDKELMELVRSEQDVKQQINAYQNLMLDMFSRPSTDHYQQDIDKVKPVIERLSAARNVILDEIEKRFPDYANIVRPRAHSIGEIQKQLRAEEVLISMYSTSTNTFVWAVLNEGKPVMTVANLSKNDLEKQVSEVRKSLFPASDTLGKLPVYDFKKAYELYSVLLKPSEYLWRDAKDIILLVSGPMSQIPLSILPTRSFQLEPEKGELFSNYRDAPWLIKNFSVTTVPSLSSFVSLRTLPRGAQTRKAFAGFGDPYFNKIQMSKALSENKRLAAERYNGDYKLHVRGIRLTKDGNLDSNNILSCDIESLSRLPDTAQEIQSIAAVLGATSEQDVYLGQRASEKQVKTMNLSDRRVIAFASHALVPYDLDGLDQPAIALSASSVTGDDDDGLLTMGEIMELKLNADWVVLSACNTGAAQGAGAEAISGLGRAFFYAGTRAILVSMWPVETTSAKELTTGIFRHQKENPELPRSRAHQQSMLELIETKDIMGENGAIVASYAHPFFWAPFIIVGDNGMTNLN